MFSKKSCSKSVLIDLDSFKKKGYNFELLVSDQGWYGLFQTKEKVYPRLVKLFYSNAVFSESKITSFVLGKDITIDADVLLNVFGVIDSDDAYYYCHHSWDNTFSMTFEQAVSGICVDLNAMDDARPSHVALRPKWAQLHRIISLFLLPKNGSHQLVTYMDTLMLYCLIHMTPLSFPNIMCECSSCRF